MLELPAGLTLYFARHGQTQANVQKRFSGNKDTPLTELGLEQAAQVGRILRRELDQAPGWQFISSPLARAVTTMKIARQAMDVPAGIHPDDHEAGMNASLANLARFVEANH